MKIDRSLRALGEFHVDCWKLGIHESAEIRNVFIVKNKKNKAGTLPIL